MSALMVDVESMDKYNQTWVSQREVRRADRITDSASNVGYAG